MIMGIPNNILTMKMEVITMIRKMGNEVERIHFRGIQS